MEKYNKIYGILTNGVKKHRDTNTDRANLTPYCTSILEALIPDELDVDIKCGLADLYINLAMTDIDCVELINLKDPYNSYTTVTYDIECGTYNWDKLVQRLKGLHLPDMSADLTYTDYIVLTMKYLLESLE